MLWPCTRPHVRPHSLHQHATPAQALVLVPVCSIAFALSLYRFVALFRMSAHVCVRLRSPHPGTQSSFPTSFKIHLILQLASILFPDSATNASCKPVVGKHAGRIMHRCRLQGAGHHSRTQETGSKHRLLQPDIRCGSIRHPGRSRLRCRRPMNLRSHKCHRRPAGTRSVSVISAAIL